MRVSLLRGAGHKVEYFGIEGDACQDYEETNVGSDGYSCNTCLSQFVEKKKVMLVHK